MIKSQYEERIRKNELDIEMAEEQADNPTLWEITSYALGNSLNIHNVSYADAVPIQEDMRLKRNALKEACTIAEMRKDRTPLANCGEEESPRSRR